MMKKFIRISIVLCFLAFVMSMSLMFVPPIESQAAEATTPVTTEICWDVLNNNHLFIGNEDDVKEATGVTTTYKWSPPTNNPTTATPSWSGRKVVITTVTFVSPISPEYTCNWFLDFAALKTIEGIENLDTSNVKNMHHMFSGCKGLTSLNVSNFNTSKVTKMTSMFSGCSNLSSLDLSSFDTSNVQRMLTMFKDCSSLRSLNQSSFNTGNVVCAK